MNPYYVMTLLYLALAALAALDASLIQFQILPAFPGQRWLLVHTVTLGAFTGLVFGLAPDLTAARKRLPRPAFRWNTWILLNGGLLVLYAGIPLMNGPVIALGGSLAFFAVILLMKQLLDLSRQDPGDGKGAPESTSKAAPQGARFYMAGLFFLLVGGLVGTSMWIGWSEPLRIAVPKEVHVHSNLWGFASLVFAGLLFDLYPGFTGRLLTRPRLVSLTFWLMTVGALGLVLGPWIGVDAFTVAGLVLHTIGTVVMLVILAIPIWGKREEWTPGIWHLALAYTWFLLAVVVAPLVVAGGAVGSEVAGSGGPILIFGWLLQLGYALIPYVFALASQPGRPAKLGGTWFTLAVANAGNLLYWASMFYAPWRSPLRGFAYLLWVASLLPILMQLATTASSKLEQIRQQEVESNP